VIVMRVLTLLLQQEAVLHALRARINQPRDRRVVPAALRALTRP
jgi:hypothetical protein